MRYQNVRLIKGNKCLGSFPLQVAYNSFRHVLDVERALPQVRIIDFIERLGVASCDFLENPFHIAKIGLQFAENFID